MSVQRKQGRKGWYVVIDDPNTEAGKRKRVWLTNPDTGKAFTTKREAERFDVEQKHARNRGSFVSPNKLLLGDYLNDWLSIVSSQLAESTIDAYRKNIRLRINPYIGKIPLQQLTAKDLDKLYATLLESGRITTGEGSGLSVKTVRSVHQTAKQALERAFVNGLVPRNVAQLATPPKSKGTTRPLAWTPEELKTFLEALDGHRLEHLFKFAAFTGMRRGEVLGLTWRSIDWQRKQVSVSQSIGKVAGKVVVTTPKTSAGRREVELDEATSELLHKVKQEQEANKELLGLERFGSGYVFCNPDGTTLYPERITRVFSELVSKLGLPAIPFHGLRHTHATILLSLGVPAHVVSARLGHSGVTITLSTYAHVLPKQQGDAANKFANYLEGTQKSNISPIKRAQ
jgi:integrase